MNQQLKLIVPPKSAQRIHDLTVELLTSGMKESTVITIGYKLSQLDRETDINNPEAVKTHIAMLKGKRTGKPLCNASKHKFVAAYQHYVKKYNLQWVKPKYKVPENIPLIPKREDVEAIINNSSKKYATIFTIEADIGCCPEELHLVTRDKINAEKGEISITGVKGHGSKSYKLKERTAEMLRLYLSKHPENQPFPKAHNQSQMFLRYKTAAAKKLCKPEIMKIELRNLRNYSGERFYKSMPIRDPIGVMQHFRHKKLETTMHYLRAMVIEYAEEGRFRTVITNSPEEEARVVEEGWILVRAFEGTTKALYKKHIDA